MHAHEIVFPILQVIRQQAIIAARTSDVQAWEETVSKHAAQHAEAMKKLQVCSYPQKSACFVDAMLLPSDCFVIFCFPHRVTWMTRLLSLHPPAMSCLFVQV